MDKIFSIMNMRDVTVAYGLTENSPIISMTKFTDSIEIRSSSVG
jgi:hypothetical protein